MVIVISYMSCNKWFIHSFIQWYQNLEEKTRFNLNLVLFFTDFSNKKKCCETNLFPLFLIVSCHLHLHRKEGEDSTSCSQIHGQLSLKVIRIFHLETRRVVEGINDGKMSKKHFAVWWLHLTLNSPKNRSQTACNLSQTAIRKNMALKHSFNKNTPCNTVRSAKPNLKLLILRTDMPFNLLLNNWDVNWCCLEYTIYYVQYSVIYFAWFQPPPYNLL